MKYLEWLYLCLWFESDITEQQMTPPPALLSHFLVFCILVSLSLYSTVSMSFHSIRWSELQLMKAGASSSYLFWLVYKAQIYAVFFWLQTNKANYLCAWMLQYKCRISKTNTIKSCSIEFSDRTSIDVSGQGFLSSHCLAKYLKPEIKWGLFISTGTFIQLCRVCW